MKIPLSWLNELIKTDKTAEEIGDILTLAGLEVDGIDERELNFTNVVVGEVVVCGQHPDAEKLKLTEVSDGETTHQVICGAPNCRQGLKVALARVGGKVGEIKIKRAKLRGVESCGMLCSGKELGISEAHEGIVELPAESVVGTDLKRLYGETIFDVSLTPNLGHCMSVLGVARELGALTGEKVNFPEIISGQDGDPGVKIEIVAKDLCSKYCCLKIDGVKVVPSPDWLARRLEDCGVRSINAVVDVLNYVMLEIGQPMHAFDAEKISGGSIRVEQSKGALKLETLDEQERDVPEGTLIICDQSGPQAIGGIMGGAGSRVVDSTTSILLEAALFDAPTIRTTSRKMGLRSESSSRFEKGVDREGPERALQRACALIIEICGGIAKGTSSSLGNSEPTPKFDVRINRVNGLLGTHLSGGEIEELLARLEIKVDAGEEVLHVQAPSYRNDLISEIDIVEEVARLFGYNNIPVAEPKVSVSAIAHDPIYLFEKMVRQRMLSEGLQEFLTCDLISPEQVKTSKESQEAIAVLHAKSVDQSVLRTSFLPGLLQSLLVNQNQHVRDIGAFEIGNLHFKDGDAFVDRPALAIVLCGSPEPLSWETAKRCATFYDLKGHVENLLEGFYVKPSFEIAELASFHPGQQAKVVVEGVEIGVLGAVHPQIVQDSGLEQDVFYAQIDLDELRARFNPRLRMDKLPMYPGSERDLTLTLDKSLPIGDVFDAIKKVPSSLLKSVQLIDLFSSEKLGADKHNATFRFQYRHDGKTLKHEVVEKEHARITSSVENLAE